MHDYYLPIYDQILIYAKNNFLSNDEILLQSQ